MTPNSPPAVVADTARRGVPAPLSPARPATPSGMSEQAQIVIAALCLFGIIFMAFSA